MNCQTAVLLLGFNRPDYMKKVLANVSKVKPPRVYFAVDGARTHKEGEQQIVEQVKGLVDSINWDCDIKTLFRETNLGCGPAVSAAISWFFEHEEYGIILEDDCVPDPSFFPFCEELLEKYHNDDRVMHISGANFQKGWQNAHGDSYYFSRIPLIWGWASWRRAWKYYDYQLTNYGFLLENGFLDDFLFNQPTLNTDIMVALESISKGIPATTWDYQWFLSTFINSGLSIIPNKNLVENIGFEGVGTHNMDIRFKVPLETAHFPLQHPLYVKNDFVSDQRYYDLYFKKGIARKIRNFLELFIPKPIVKKAVIARQKQLWASNQI